MNRRAATIVMGLAAGVAVAEDGLRIASWNISNYSGGRQNDLNNAFYTEFEGRSMSPDVLIGQEFLSQAAVNSMLAILNAAPGSPGDWAAGPFVNGPDTDNALFYRTSRVEFLGMTILPADGTSGAPRDVNRYDLALVGYAHPSTQIALYSSHMKAGSGSDDQARRLIEARKIRDDAETLDPAINIILGGDFNIQSSSQAAYQELVGFQADNNGRFADPIATPGSWNNNAAFRFVHTQDPSGAGGMDDRHDQILLDPALGDGVGLEYRGVFGLPYSTSSWNDPNHSYRAWGNDGTSFDAALRITGNTMVGPTIALSLIAVAGGGGHLPVFVDLVVPPLITADAVIDLGPLAIGAVVDAQLTAGNAGAVDLWGPTGIGDLQYTIDADPGINIPAGPFADAPGGLLNTHLFSADLAHAPGPVAAEIRIHSNDPDEPVRTVLVTATVVGCSIADLAPPYGTLDFFDVADFLDAFSAGDPIADLTGDGLFNFFDVADFLDAFSSGCP